MKTDEIAAVGEAVAILNEDSARDTMKSALPGAAAFISKAANKPVQDFEALVETQHEKVTVAPHKKLMLAQNHHTGMSDELKEPKDATEFAGSAEKVVHFMINNMVE